MRACALFMRLSLSLSSADAQHTCCCINPAINCNFPWQNTPQECCIVSNCAHTSYYTWACTYAPGHMFLCISALSLLSPRKLCTISALMRLWLNLMKSYALAIASAVSSRQDTAPLNWRVGIHWRPSGFAAKLWMREISFGLAVRHERYK
jgi:hypothetical protein